MLTPVVPAASTLPTVKCGEEVRSRRNIDAMTNEELALIMLNTDDRLKIEVAAMDDERKIRRLAFAGSARYAGID